MNLKIRAGKSQRKKFLHLLNDTRTLVTTGSIDVHLGNKERSRLSVKPGGKIEEKKKKSSLTTALSKAKALSQNFFVLFSDCLSRNTL